MNDSGHISSTPASGFAAMVLGRSGPLYILKTYDAAHNPCRFALRSDERRVARLRQTTNAERIDLTQYGQVVASGWGHTVDEGALKAQAFASPNTPLPTQNTA